MVFPANKKDLGISCRQLLLHIGIKPHKMTMRKYGNPIQYIEYREIHVYFSQIETHKNRVCIYRSREIHPLLLLSDRRDSEIVTKREDCRRYNLCRSLKLDLFSIHRVLVLLHVLYISGLMNKNP